MTSNGHNADAGAKYPRPYCVFGVFDEHLDPDEVTHTLGVQPDRVARKGDRPRRSQVSIKKGLWAKDSSLHVDSDCLDDHLRWMMDLIPIDRARRIPGAETLKLSMYVYMPEADGGASIPVDVVRFAAEIGACIDVHTCYWPDEDIAQDKGG